MEGRSIEKRFAYNLLEKLLKYLDQAGVRMKVRSEEMRTQANDTFPRSFDPVKTSLVA